VIIILIVVVNLPDRWQGSWSRPSREASLSGRGLRGASVINEGRWEADLAKWREPLSAFWGAYNIRPALAGVRLHQSIGCTRPQRWWGGVRGVNEKEAPFWCARVPKGGSPSQFVGSAPIGEERLLSCDPPHHSLGPLRDPLIIFRHIINPIFYLKSEGRGIIIKQCQKKKTIWLYLRTRKKYEK